MDLNISKKRGRPKKDLPRICCLRVACNQNELNIIKEKANQIQLTISEYLRKVGIDSQIDMKPKRVLPKEVLLFTAQLSHLAANINSLSYKNNRAENFNYTEKALLNNLAQEVQQLAIMIKIFLK